MKIFYFTATGNSLYVSKRLGGGLYSIPKLLKEDNLSFRAEKIGLVFPCYYFGTPRIVKEFLDKAELKSDYIFAIMTYGNMAGAGVTHFEKVAKQKGIKLSYTNELLMVDNYLPMFDIAEQLEKEDSKEIEENLEQIIEDIKIKRESLVTKSWWKKGLTLGTQFFYNLKSGNDDEKFHVEDNCTACGTCEKVCPVNNIKIESNPLFKHHCEKCLACINLCPEQAIKLDREKGTERFQNKNVSLEEIIEANN